MIQTDMDMSRVLTHHGSTSRGSFIAIAGSRGPDDLGTTDATCPYDLDILSRQRKARRGGA